MMEDRKEMENTPGGDPRHEEFHEDLEETLHDLRELENMKKFLEEQNEESREQVDALKSEMEGMDISISATRAYVEAYEQRKTKSLHDMHKLRAKKELLTAEINDIRLKIRALKEDEESTAILINNLKGELEEIQNEKAIVVKRLEGLSEGMDRISHDREDRLPRLHGYDKICKQINTVLKEAQNRMEVSLKLRKPWTS